MNEHPEHVTAALAEHAEFRRVYEGHIAKCTDLAANMARNRTAAEAAAVSSDAAGAEWREELRRTSGKITPKISKLKSEAFQDRETSEELFTIVAELDNELLERQYAAHDARDNYLSIRTKALKAYLDDRIARAVDQLLSTAEGQAFCVVLRASLAMSGMDLASSPYFTNVGGQPSQGLLRSTQQMFTDVLERKVNAIIVAPFLAAMKAVPTVDDPILADLAELPRTDAEGRPQDMGLARRHQVKQQRANKSNGTVVNA